MNISSNGGEKLLFTFLGYIDIYHIPEFLNIYRVKEKVMQHCSKLVPSQLSKVKMNVYLS